MKTAVETLKIVVLCIVSAIVYGILHDQVTARVCVEYFTIGHPPIFHTDDPTLLAFVGVSISVLFRRRRMARTTRQSL